MNDLGDQLDRAAGAPEPDLDLGALQARVRRRGQTRRAVLASGACAALLLVGGVAWAASQGDGSEQQVTAGEGDGAGGAAPTLFPSSTTSEALGTTTSTAATVPPTPSTLLPETTTSVAPTTTTPPPTTTVPAGARTIEARGTYTGQEQYRFDTTECGRAGMELSHGLASRWTPTSITGEGADLIEPGTWDVKSDYCSKVDGATWSGSGQFAISLPGNATLQGTFDDQTAYPTDGEPYQLRVEEGAGPFEGVTGACDVTVRITDKRLGSQTQSGEFRCSLTIPARSSAGATPSAPDPSAPAAFG